MVKETTKETALWLVLAIACSGCADRGAAVFDHEPTEDEVAMVRKKLGNMNCITLYVSPINLNEFVEVS